MKNLKIGLFVFLYLIAYCAFPQTNQLKGRVVNAETGSGVPSATIYVALSTLKAICDQNGYFELSNITWSDFTLVASSIGYKTNTQHILTNSMSGELVISLVPDIYEIEEIAIRRNSDNRKDWKRWGSLFMLELIGSGGNAQQTKLLNPEVLIFQYDEEEGILRVSADEPLRLRNSALGYMLIYDLEDFTVNYSKKETLFFGYLHFEDIGKGKRAIAKARAHAYHWSITKFLRSTFYQTWNDEGYEVYQLSLQPNREKMRVQDSLERFNQGKTDLSTHVFLKDSVSYYEEVLAQEDFILHLGERLHERHVSIQDDKEFKVLSFNAYLLIQNPSLVEIHPNKYEYNATRFTSTVTRRDTTASIRFNKDGFYSPIDNLIWSGYYGQVTKLSNLLPIDYAPLK